MGACDCSACKAECKRLPGWFTPEEARRAIEAGQAERLTAVTQAGAVPTAKGLVRVKTTAIAPARCGDEGRESVFGHGRCTFLTNQGLCEIHTSDFKPLECVTGFACRDPEPGADVGTMFKLWSSPEGKAVVELWRRRPKVRGNKNGGGMTHDWVKSPLGHGNLMCRRCFITDLEAAALNLSNYCEAPVPKAANENDAKAGIKDKP